MKSLVDGGGALAAGLTDIRRQFKLPERFPAEVEQAAAQAATRQPTGHRDLTAWPFVTLDPAASTDLDQAFHIERSGGDVLLHYAIADVAWFVDDGGPIDRESWRRGTTQYLPDGKTRLYPASLSEGAASLLPDGPRPAVVFHVRVDEHGAARLDCATRAVIRSRAKLAYDSVTASQLPEDFVELWQRIGRGEEDRGAARVDPAEQEVVRTPAGGYELTFRPRLASEDQNAAMSLATNLAVAASLFGARTGLFRVMDPPDQRAVARLRHTARALGVSWAEGRDLAEFERGLSPADPKQAAMMLAIRRSGGHARYEAFTPAHAPWHEAVAAAYAHATAPLRRLADRYVVMAALAVATNEPVPPTSADAFSRLPPVMGDADALGSQIDRAVVDLAEAVMMADRIGSSFAAVVTDVDERGARIQLSDLPVVGRVPAHRVQPGDPLTVVVTAADARTRTVSFTRAG